MFSESYQLGFDAGWELDLFGRKRRAAEPPAPTSVPSRPTWPMRRYWSPPKWHAITSSCAERRSASRWPSTLENLRDTQKLTEARWELGAGSELDVQSSRAA